MPVGPPRVVQVVTKTDKVANKELNVKRGASQSLVQTAAHSFGKPLRESCGSPNPITGSARKNGSTRVKGEASLQQPIRIGGIPRPEGGVAQRRNDSENPNEVIEKSPIVSLHAAGRLASLTGSPTRQASLKEEAVAGVLRESPEGTHRFPRGTMRIRHFSRQKRKPDPIESRRQGARDWGPGLDVTRRVVRDVESRRTKSGC